MHRQKRPGARPTSRLVSSARSSGTYRDPRRRVSRCLTSSRWRGSGRAAVCRAIHIRPTQIQSRASPAARTRGWAPPPRAPCGLLFVASVGILELLLGRHERLDVRAIPTHHTRFEVAARLFLGAAPSLRRLRGRRCRFAFGCLVLCEINWRRRRRRVLSEVNGRHNGLSVADLTPEPRRGS